MPPGPRFRPAAALLLAALLSPAPLLPCPAFEEAPPRAPARTGGVIAEGTPHETRYHVQDTGKPGPTVLVVGGVHGNEPGGIIAAGQIRHWPLLRGKVVVLPRANASAIRAGTRDTPGAEKPLANLNRNFPRAGREEGPRGEPASSLWRFVETLRPDWLLSLHEGIDFHRKNPRSVGSSVILKRSPETEEVAKKLAAAVNATITDPVKEFVCLGPPVDGSLARAAAEHLGSRVLILETTTRGQARSRRVRQHRILVHRALEHLGMIDDAVPFDWTTDRGDLSIRTRIALYDAGGTAGKGVPNLLRQLGAVEGLEVVPVGPDEIREGSLAQFDVVVFSGGSGSGQARALAGEGRAEVVRFVRSGGGYVGVCAGAYLAATFPWGLGILDAKTVSSRWRRGTGTVKMEFTDAGRAILGGGAGEVGVRYANGPILEPAGKPDLPDFEVLARFRTEVADHGAPVGIMTGAPAIVGGEFGNGRVVCFSPHPEQTAGLEGLVPRALRWVTRAE